ncbi:MAG: sigma-54-dependent Fis family transcriptional regulator [Alphaproteobacteria bacterium]|nr:MAG: sigma-54-dependent Fis family transcriptional regulator [Alphaproteobacteria bacterium]
MAEPEPSILIVEDSPTMALTYREYLRGVGREVRIAETGKAALAEIADHNPGVVLLDLKLPDMDGLDILKKLTTEHHRARVIVITAHGSVATAVDAMRDGATDFLLKPFPAERLVTTVKNALEIHRLEGLVEQYAGRKSKKFGRFIGDSPAMQAVYRMIEDSAASRASVFIMGPSGTGKELCAEALHQLSPRRAKRFVALNCAAIPANLIESEIFGHKKGAFTGAVADRDGAAVAADGGTLFLDEICEMPLDLQAKLLRFIQTGHIVPVGSNESRRVDVRFVCATNRIPWEEVEAGRFREDLYYRLHVVPIHVPPLKDRGDDVLLIAREMLKHYAAEEDKDFEGLSADAEERLLAHGWPGNVRELGNVIQSAVVLNEGPALTAAMLQALMGPSRRAASATGVQQNGPETVASATLQAPGRDNGVIEPLAVVERRVIERAIKLSGGKVGLAAKKLGVNASTLYRKIKDWS